MNDAFERVNRFGGYLRCGVCGEKAPLGDTARYLDRGWPMCCCTYTMTWWTQAQIDAGEIEPFDVAVSS